MGAIADKARRTIAERVPVGTFNLQTGQVETRPADANDVSGMLQPVLDAIAELEDKLDGAL